MKVVIIGGGAAGMSAASRVKRLRRDVDVVVLEGSNMVSHAPCGIPYYLEGLFDNYDLLMHYTPDYFRNVRGINVRLNEAVVEVGQNYVKTNKGNSFDWDYLVLATGAIPITPSIPVRGDHVFMVHHPAEAMRLRDALYSVSTIGIIGTGYVGLEVAEALRFRGKDVVMIGRSGYPLRKSLDEDIGNIVKDELIKYGVKLRLNEKILEIDSQGDKQVIITDGGKYMVDAVILATGIRPNIELARQLNLRIGETGAVWVNEYMRTSIDSIYAAGDIAETKNLITSKPYWHPFGTTANKMGFVAGSNIVGKPMIFPGVVGTSMTRFMNLYIASTGLTTQEAVRYGFKVRSAVITARTKARYYPGGGYVTIKLIIDERNMRLVGAQVLGDDGSYVLGKIDTLAALMVKGAAVEDLFMSDLAYLPAVTQVWDPLIIVARQFLRD